MWAVGTLRRLERYTGTDMVYLAKGGFWINANTVIVTILSFILSIEFASLLSKETYGTYQFILSIASILSAFTLTGMNTAVTQAVARGFEGTFKKAVHSQLVWGLVPMAAGFAVSLYYLIRGAHMLSLSFVIVALLLPLWNSFNTYSAFFQGKKDFRSSFFYAQILNAVYYAAMLAILFFVDTAAWLILVSFSVNAGVTGLLYFFTVRKHQSNTTEDPEAISYGKHLSIMTGFASLASPIDNIVIYHFLGAPMLAIYAFASTIPERVNGVTKSIIQLALPKFSTSDLPTIKSMIVRRTFQFIGFGLVLSIIYILAAPLLFQWFFPQYLSSVIYSQAYVIAAVCMTSSSFPQTALVAVKAKKELYIFNFISPILQVVLLVVLGWLYGVWGVIIARAVAGLALLLMAFWLIFSIKSIENPEVS